MIIGILGLFALGILIGKYWMELNIVKCEKDKKVLIINGEMYSIKHEERDKEK